MTRQFDANDWYISLPVSGFDSPFYGSEVPEILNASEVINTLAEGRYKLLIKRPEKYDKEVKRLLDAGLNQILGLTGESLDDVLRCESGIFVTGTQSITPYHFDPEHGFFMQISGEKIYHIYHPDALTEQVKESHYARNKIDIGRIEWREAAEQHELMLELTPGTGLHQPANSPHWVETLNTLSVSFAFGYETRKMRAIGKTYAFNKLVRRTGFRPKPVGQSRSVDELKSKAMMVIQPLRDLSWNVRSQLGKVIRAQLSGS